MLAKCKHKKNKKARKLQRNEVQVCLKLREKVNLPWLPKARAFVRQETKPSPKPSLNFAKSTYKSAQISEISSLLDKINTASLIRFRV